MATKEEFFQALASSLRWPRHVKRPAPTNLDGMADLLKEAKVATIVCSDWSMDKQSTAAIKAVCEDLNVSLLR